MLKFSMIIALLACATAPAYAHTIAPKSAGIRARAISRGAPRRKPE